MSDNDDCPRCGIEHWRADEHDRLYCLSCGCYYDPDNHPGLFIYVHTRYPRELVWAISNGERERLISASRDDTSASIWAHIDKAWGGGSKI